MRVFALAVAFALVGCAAASPTLPTFQLARCEAPISDGNDVPSPAVSEGGPPEDALADRQLFAFCGQLNVAGLTGARTIQVALVSDRDSDPLNGRRALFYHPGGPGISPVERLLRSAPDVDYGMFAAVTWDGATSSSAPGACGPLAAAYATDRDPFDPSGAAGVGDECRSMFGAETDPGAAVAADELDAIRAALGAETIDLLMHSYGTAIAEAYLMRHPDRVRRAVLDGPMALDAPWIKRVAAIDKSMRQVVGKMLERCSASCPPALVGLAAQGSYDLVREAVLEASPQVGSSKLVLTGLMLDQATLLALRDPLNWEDFFRALDQGLRGDGTGLWTAAENQFFSLDRSVYYSSICSDIQHPDVLGGYEVPVANPLLATLVSDLAPCLAIDQKPLGAPGDSPVDRPDVLVLASPLDVLTPLGLLDGSSRLGAMATCTTDVVGHTSFADERVADVVSRFLAGGDADAAATSCAEFNLPGI